MQNPTTLLNGGGWGCGGFAWPQDDITTTNNNSNNNHTNSNNNDDNDGSISSNSKSNPNSNRTPPLTQTFQKSPMGLGIPP